MKPTDLPANYVALEEILVRELTDAVRKEGVPHERITALTGALQVTVASMGQTLNMRHWVANQGMMMQQAAQQASPPNLHRQ